MFKAATGLSVVGLTGNSCGALTGGVMALSCHLGRDYAHFLILVENAPQSFRLADKLQRI